MTSEKKIDEIITTESCREAIEEVQAEAKAEKPKKRLKIRIEDSDDGEVQEFETQAMVLCMADDYDDDGAVAVNVVRNLKGVMRSCAIAMRLEEEPQQIQARLLRIAEEDDAQ